MFDSSYPVTPLGVSTNISQKYLKKIYKYFFDTEDGTRYIIHLEHYPNNIFVIKFYPRKLKNNKFRYNVLTKRGHFTKIIRTNINLLISFYKQYPDSHFGFIGAKTYCPIKKTFTESEAMTRRFMIYRYAMVNLINPDDFDHHEDKNKSTYLLINSNTLDGDKIKSEATKMYEDCIT